MPSLTMTSADLARHRLALERRLQELAGEIGADRAKIDGEFVDGDEVLDRKERADIASRAPVDDAELARDLAESAAVRAALSRIDDGRYGLCVDCDEPIGLQRLMVQPAAARCAACQAAAERGR